MSQGSYWGAVRGGAGLANGYLHRAAETRRRFADRTLPDGTRRRFYATGDMVAMDSGGTLRFVGRQDGQVKLRGFRIELEDIESQIRRLPGVQEAAAQVFKVGNHESLVAYFVIGSGEGSDTVAVTPRQVRAHLAQRLPQYMIPSQCIAIGRIPKTASGKLLREALPKPDLGGGNEARVHAAPTRGRERQLARIWSEVLGVDDIGRHDDFFDLGGHSLLAMKMLHLVEQQYGARAPLIELMRGATIAHLARSLDDVQTRGALVPLRAGTGAPIVLLHPVGGMLIGYRHLLQELETPRPVYGLEAYGLRAGESPVSDLREMARRYAAELEDTLGAPTGAETLVGWSMGGLIALELSERYCTPGGRFPEVLLIDSMLPVGANGESVAAAHSNLDAFTRDLADQTGLELSGGVQSAGSSSEQVWTMMRERLEKDGLAGESALAQAVHHASVQAFNSFEPRQYSASTELVFAKNGMARRYQKVLQSYLGTVARVTEIPGDHYSILRPPQISMLSALLEDHLKNAIGA